MQTIEYVFFTTFCRYHDDDDDHRSHCRRRHLVFMNTTRR